MRLECQSTRGRATLSRGSWITGLPFEEFLRRWRGPAEGYDPELDTETDHELRELWWSYQPPQDCSSMKPDKAKKRPPPDGGCGGGKRLFSGGGAGSSVVSSSGCAA